MAIPDKFGARWDDEQDTQLCDLLKTAFGLREIAEQMGRTPGAIVARMEFIAQHVTRFRQLRELIRSELP